MKMTSAYANKLLTQLQDDKSFWIDKEKNSCVYTAAVDEEPNVPDYDYEEVAGKIEEIDEKICKLKHAINLVNINTKVCCFPKNHSIDALPGKEIPATETSGFCFGMSSYTKT